MRRLLTLLTLLSPSAAGEPTILAQSTAAQFVRQVELRPDGPLVGVTEADLLKLVALAPGEQFTPAGIRSTIRQIHATRLFFDVQAHVDTVAPNQVDVAFVLLRAYRIDRIEFSGDVPMSRNLLGTRLPLRPRVPYSQRLLDESLEALRGIYREYGFYRPVIRHTIEVDDSKAIVRVRFQIDAGPQIPIGSLQYESEPPELTSSLSLGQLRLQPGQPFSPQIVARELETVRRRLSRRGYLRAVVYIADEAELDFSREVLDLSIRIVAREHTDIQFTGTPLDPELVERMPLFTSSGPGAAFPPRSADFLRRALQDDGYLAATVELQEDTAFGRPEQLTFHVDRGPTLTLRQIDFQGNTALDDETLGSIVSLRPRGTFSGGKLSQEALDQDVERLQRAFQRLGFLDAIVTPDFEVTANDLRVIFRVEEGPQVRVRYLDIRGVVEVSAAEIRQRMRLADGQPYSPLLLAEDRTAVMALYEDRGFRNVEFVSEIDRISADEVDVAVVITEHDAYRVAATLVLGNRRTRRSVIENRIELVGGQPFSQNDALQTETNLYDLAIFNRVRIRDIPRQADPLERFVLIEVEEARQYLVQYGLGYSSFEGVRGTVGFSNNNLFGAARSLSLNLRAGARRQRGNLSLTFPRPFAIRLPTVLSLSVDNDNRVDRGPDDRISDVRGRPFDSLRYIASLQSEQKLSRTESLFYRYKFESVKLNVPDDFQEPLEFFRTEDVRLSSVSVTYLNDAREPTFDPQGGFFLNGEAQLTPKFLGSEAQFLRILTQGQYYLGLSPRFTLATSLRLGTIVPFGEDASELPETTVPISEQFFAGGASTLRGLPQDLAGPLLRDENGDLVLVNRGTEDDPDLVAVAEGGNALVIANVELRYPILGILAGAVFYDVGNVYRSFRDFSGGDLSHSVGLSLGLRTPVGPIRFDVAYNPSPPDAPGFRRWLLHFNLGHPF